MTKERLIINGSGDTKDVQLSASIRFPDKKIAVSNPQSWLTRMIDQQRARNEAEFSQNEATVKIETPLRYFGVFFTGDWHLGSDKVDYQMWDAHQTLVVETPGMMEAIVGDERDNFVNPKHMSGLFEGILNPQEQMDFIMWWLKNLNNNGKILARTGGNHDGWSWFQSGIAPETYWYKEITAPLLRNGGFVHTFFNDVKYDIYLHHGLSRFNSNFNPNHATKRAYEFQGRFDVGAMGHTHVSEVAHGWRNNDSQQHDYVQLRTGTYKMDDQYARAMQMGRGQPPGATVLFNTRERHMIPFAKLEDAVEVLNRLNRG